MANNFSIGVPATSTSADQPASPATTTEAQPNSLFSSAYSLNPQVTQSAEASTGAPATGATGAGGATWNSLLPGSDTPAGTTPAATTPTETTTPTGTASSTPADGSASGASSAVQEFSALSPQMQGLVAANLPGNDLTTFFSALPTADQTQVQTALSSIQNPTATDVANALSQLSPQDLATAAAAVPSTDLASVVSQAQGSGTSTAAGSDTTPSSSGAQSAAVAEFAKFSPQMQAEIAANLPGNDVTTFFGALPQADQTQIQSDLSGNQNPTSTDLANEFAKLSPQDLVAAAAAVPSKDLQALDQEAQKAENSKTPADNTAPASHGGLLSGGHLLLGVGLAGGGLLAYKKLIQPRFPDKLPTLPKFSDLTSSVSNRFSFLNRGPKGTPDVAPATSRAAGPDVAPGTGGAPDVAPAGGAPEVFPEFETDAPEVSSVGRASAEAGVVTPAANVAGSEVAPEVSSVARAAGGAPAESLVESVQDGTAALHLPGQEGFEETAGKLGDLTTGGGAHTALDGAVDLSKLTGGGALGDGQAVSDAVSDTVKAWGAGGSAATEDAIHAVDIAEDASHL